MFALAQKLRAAGILGINQRNAEYTLAYNQRRLYPLVDDKLRTKRLAMDAGLAVPELYTVIESQGQIPHLAEILADYQDFVIKPSRGSGGDGIVVISGRSKSNYRSVSGTLIDEAWLEHHVSNTLSGTYSLGGSPDVAMVEYRVRFDPVFEAISYQGVPDVRIIVFLGVPVMAMVRLPTRRSGGKANLHQGAIGAGVNLADGVTIYAVSGNENITEHPDTGNPVAGVQIPQWNHLLHIAASCHELTGLGYLGVDLVLDHELGPLILELNARPGLNIQIANRAGLLKRLRAVEDKIAQLADSVQRINFAKAEFDAFAGNQAI